MMNGAPLAIQSRLATRALLCAFALAGLTASPLAAQAGAGADTAGRDSARTLGSVRVTVTRAATSAQRAPWAVDVQDKRAIQQGQATLGIDEVLNNVPGVIVSNRYNYSVDQRLSIRGAGARSNFGIRGVKVLLDGVPQSLPDGQNQMTNVDLGAVSRVEVLRGSASSLYGNGSGGVIAFETDRSAPDRFGITARALGGTYGTSKYSVRMAGRGEKLTSSLALSRTRVDGFRMYDTAQTTQMIGTLDYALNPNRTLELRASYADSPVARNPGALTQAEYDKNRDSASAFNLARGANKSLSQAQYSARLREQRSFGEGAVVAYVQRRFIDNPLATAPPGTTGAAIGTYSTLNRWVTGARLDLSGWQPANPGRARINAGVDLQRSFDIRRNFRATGGSRTAATDTLFLDQGEAVTALGPFVAMQYSPLEPLTLSVGLRQDWITFAVTDNFLRDNVNNSGTRTMSALSEHLGASWVFGPRITAYANFAQAFETPTTTELSARPGGAGGFNPDLDPQNVTTIEAGIRGDLGPRFRYTLTGFRTSYTSAIVQYLESTGRAFFRNAGETKNEGLEAGFNATISPVLDAFASWTESRYRFVRYLAPRTATITDTLDGKRVAGVPDRFYRVGLRWHHADWSVDADRTWSGDLYADDRNLIKVPGWQDGVVNVRAAWEGTIGGTRFAPFIGVNNALNVSYIGAVTVNGANGRVLEPAPRKHYFVGFETGWHVAR
jgi:iron complex outermembrane receptor protein